MKNFIKRLNIFLMTGAMVQLSFVPLSEASMLEENTKRFIKNTHLTEKSVDVKTALNSVKADADPKTFEIFKLMFASKMNEKLPQIQVQKVKDKQYNKDILRIFLIGKDYPIPVDIIDKDDVYARFGKETITYQDMTRFLPALEKVERALASYEKGPSRMPSSIQAPVMKPKKSDSFLLDRSAFQRLNNKEKVEYIQKIRELMLEGEKLQQIREPSSSKSKKSVDNYLFNQFLFGESAWAQTSDATKYKKPTGFKYEGPEKKEVSSSASSSTGVSSSPSANSTSSSVSSSSSSSSSSEEAKRRSRSNANSGGQTQNNGSVKAVSPTAAPLAPGDGVRVKPQAKPQPQKSLLEVADQTVKAVTGVEDKKAEPFTLQVKNTKSGGTPSSYRGQPCVIAGHFSTYPPGKFSCGADDPDFQSGGKFSQGCSNGGVRCNETLFGYDRSSGGPICIPRSSIKYATRECNAASPLRPGNAADSGAFINSISKHHGKQKAVNDNNEIIDEAAFEEYQKFKQEFDTYLGDARTKCQSSPPDIKRIDDQKIACENIENRALALELAKKKIEDKQNQEDQKQVDDIIAKNPNCEPAINVVRACKDDCKIACEAAASNPACADVVKGLPQCSSSGQIPIAGDIAVKPPVEDASTGACPKGQIDNSGICIPGNDVNAGYDKTHKQKPGFFSKVGKFFMNPKVWAVMGVVGLFWLGARYVSKNTYCKKYNCKSVVDSTDDGDRRDESYPTTAPTGMGILDPSTPGRGN